MTQALINPDIISWARQRAGLELSVLAKKLGINKDRLVTWERGDARPTFKQAMNVAHHTYIPFGYLFLKEPPVEEIPIPDLRTIGDHEPGNISINLRDTIRDVVERQTWYQEYLREQDISKVDVVGRLRGKTDASTIANDMKTMMALEPWPNRGRWDDYARELIARIESLGILVMRNSMVGNNSHRPLNIHEFRGFAIADEYAPVIFINTQDCPEARLFTLIHELTHIWLGESGISDTKPDNQNQIEKICNSVAAEFLAPEHEFRSYWDTESDDWKSNLSQLATHFHVSTWVIARRALELALISTTEYWAFVNKLLDRYKNQERNGQPTYNRLQTGRVSKRLAQAVASEALSGRMLLRDAWKLIGIKPEKLAIYARKELNF